MKKISLIIMLSVIFYSFTAAALVRIINYTQFVEIRKQMFPILIDARPKKEFDGVTIPGAVNVPVNEMTEQRLSSLINSKSYPVIFFSKSMAASDGSAAANKASGFGYTNLFVYTGGVQDFQEKSSPKKQPAPAATTAKQLTPSNIPASSVNLPYINKR